MTKVRVRFAPSPTGPLHIGGARSALFNYLLAQRVGGDFIVRIEDTDRERSTPESEENIKDSLRWLGIDWNEGVDVGGAYGPYRQTERLKHYQAAAQKLLAEGKAYYCYCSEEELAQAREQQLARGETPHYNGCCRNLTAEECAEREKAGIKPVVRFAVPKNQELVIDDLVRGQVTFNSDEIGGDFVIVKSDGIPTYNFAVVVDDYEMEISHVIRGEEHLSNTPRQLLLFQAFNYPRPTFAHVSLILGPDHSKMSKRHGSVSVVNYRNQGYLPQAIVNFLALLGWSPEGEDELLALDQLIKQFSLSRVSKSPAVFDINKLRWLNAQYLRKLEPQQIAAGIAPYLPPDFDAARTLLLAQTLANHLEIFSDVNKFLPLIQGKNFEIEEEAAPVLQQEHVPGLLERFTELIAAIPAEEFSAESVKAAIKQAGKDTGAKGAALFMVLRVAITGCQHGPDIDKLAALMGQELLLARLRGERDPEPQTTPLSQTEISEIGADSDEAAAEDTASAPDMQQVEPVSTAENATTEAGAAAADNAAEYQPAEPLRTGLRLYNSQSGQKEYFEPLEQGKVGIYCCGPTTYNYIHLGNARPLVVFDTIRRYLLWRGLDVTFVQNFTDVDDKIIQRAQQENMEPGALAEKYIAAYFEDAAALQVLPADVHPKVTEHMPEIIALIAKIIERGHAYAADGDVYFNVRSLPSYGELSGRNVEDLRSGARVLPGEHKRDPLDFALWKAAKPGEPAWDSPWGQGRPGWHIECSAMSGKYLGDNFDIHGGGADLIFPHHENEIAQSKAASGAGFARYWMHNGFITVNQEKMSKSLGNFFLLREIIAKYPGDVVRFFLLSTHYRSPIDFSDDKLDIAAKSLERIRNSQRLLDEALQRAATATAEAPQPDTGLSAQIETIKAEFIAAMDDDFNTALAISCIFTFCHDLNSALNNAQQQPTAAELQAAAQLFVDFDQVLGMILPRPEQAVAADSLEEPLLELLMQVRATARANKDWAMADAIRDGLKELDIIIEDTPQGARWKRV